MKLFNKLKNACFWSIFGPFSQFWWQKKTFWGGNPALSSTTSYGFLAPWQKRRVFQSFRKKINFIQPSLNYFLGCRNPKRIKIITRLRLGLSHLREQTFKHSFQDTINPLCNCDQDIESSTHFFLHCPFFINERRTLLSTIHSLDIKLLDCTDYEPTQTLLFGNISQISSNNYKIIKAFIDYILSSKRFDKPPFKMNSLISKSEFSQQFSFFIYCYYYYYYYYFIYFIYLSIYFSYFILPSTFQYIGNWQSYNLV